MNHKQQSNTIDFTNTYCGPALFYDAGIILIPILQIKKAEFREIMQIIQGHRVSGCSQSPDVLNTTP